MRLGEYQAKYGRSGAAFESDAIPPRTWGFVALSRLMYRVSRVLVAFVFISFGGCGGGTTGTSPADTVKFTGYAEQANGSRAGTLSMTVRSGATDQTLVDSGTDSQGEFSMELPGEEEALIVDVTGVGAASFVRNQRGDGAMSAKLAVTADGTLQIEQLSEAQVATDESGMCTNVSVNGSTVVVTGEVGDMPCRVMIRIASDEVPLTSFEGRLVGRCGDALTVIAVSRSSSAGGIDLDLNAAFSRRCDELSIVVSSSRAPDLQSVFTVEQN